MMGKTMIDEAANLRPADQSRNLNDTAVLPRQRIAEWSEASPP